MALLLYLLHYDQKNEYFCNCIFLLLNIFKIAHCLKVLCNCVEWKKMGKILRDRYQRRRYIHLSEQIIVYEKCEIKFEPKSLDNGKYN